MPGRADSDVGSVIVDHLSQPDPVELKNLVLGKVMRGGERENKE